VGEAPTPFTSCPSYPSAVAAPLYISVDSYGRHSVSAPILWPSHCFPGEVEQRFLHFLVGILALGIVICKCNKSSEANH